MTEYRSSFPPVYVTVDVVLLTIRDDQLQVLMIKRRSTPWRGWWALPGGFVRQDEDLPAAARRELAKESGLAIEPSHLEQLETFGAPARDPRARTVSVAYVAVLPGLGAPTAGTDAVEAGWKPVQDLIGRRLPFDHAKILRAGIERVRGKLEYTSLATAFVNDQFTIAELRRVYERVWGRTLDPGNFQRKVQAADGFLSPAQGSRTVGRGRPAKLFRAGSETLLIPPILR